MNLNLPLRTILVISLLLKMGYSSSQTRTTSTFNKKKELEKSIKFEVLPNGLSYFIKPVKDSLQNVKMILYHKVGSNQEDDDQRAVAHAVEHLAFYSSDLFPDGIRNSDINSRLGTGMYDFTASSGRNTTQYNFEAPDNDIATLREGLLWFRDIINGLHLKESDISQVKGELRQEFLMKTENNLEAMVVESGMYSNMIPCYGNMYNYLDNLNDLTVSSFHRFYRDWYRPDLMAIGILGNVSEVEKIENTIKNVFSDIAAPKDPRPLTGCNTAYYNQAPQFSAIERKHDYKLATPNNAVNLYLIFRDPLSNDSLNTIEGTKRLIKMELLIGILQERFKEATNDYNSFDYLITNPYKVWKLPPALEIRISDYDDNEKETLEKTTHLINQLQTHGALEEEWDQQKQKVLQDLNPDYENNIHYWADEIKLFFSHGQALPTGKLAILRNWLINFSLHDFNCYLQLFLSTPPEDIGIVAPTNHQALTYKEEDVREWIEDIYLDVPDPYQRSTPPAAVISEYELLNLKESDYEDYGTGVTGAKKILLDNGVRVIFKSHIPTKDFNKKIFLHGFSRKGADIFPDTLYASAINAPNIIRNSGINELNKFELNHFLSKTSITPASIMPYIDIQESGIYGDADLKDIEILLQFVYLYFTSPNKSKEAFIDWKEREKINYRNSGAKLISLDNYAALKKFTGDRNLRRIFGRRVLEGTDRFKGVDRTNFEDAYSIYKEIFGKGNDFTFIISGNFEISKILPLVQKYLGNLPQSAENEAVMTFKEPSNPLRWGPRYISFSAPGNYDMKNIKYSIRYLQESIDPLDWQEQLNVRLLGLIITHKAWSLRFGKEFALYHINFYGTYNPDMNRFEIAGTLDCVPTEFPELRRELQEIVADIKKGEISPDVLREATSRMEFLYSQDEINNPRTMQEMLYMHYRFNQPWVEEKVLREYVQSLTLKDVIETANKYLQKDNLFEFVMMPNSL